MPSSPAAVKAPWTRRSSAAASNRWASKAWPTRRRPKGPFGPADPKNSHGISKKDFHGWLREEIPWISGFLWGKNNGKNYMGFGILQELEQKHPRTTVDDFIPGPLWAKPNGSPDQAWCSCKIESKIFWACEILVILTYMEVSLPYSHHRFSEWIFPDLTSSSICRWLFHEISHPVLGTPISGSPHFVNHAYLSIIQFIFDTKPLWESSQRSARWCSLRTPTRMGKWIQRRRESWSIVEHFPCVLSWGPTGLWMVETAKSCCE